MRRNVAGTGVFWSSSILKPTSAMTVSLLLTMPIVLKIFMFKIRRKVPLASRATVPRRKEKKEDDDEEKCQKRKMMKMMMRM